MSLFTASELSFLRSHRLARMATVGADGTPHVVPVAYRLNDDGTIIELGGRDFGRSKKWRDLLARPRVAVVVDDVAGDGVERTPTGIEIRGRAVVHHEGGDTRRPRADPEWVEVVPERIVSWGIDGDPYTPLGRDASSG